MPPSIRHLVARRSSVLVVLGLGLAAAPVAGRPYQDTQGRFKLDLAEGWNLTPAFGDLAGMVFGRTLASGERASFSVHVDVVPADSVAGFAQAVEAADPDVAGAAPSRQERRVFGAAEWWVRTFALGDRVGRFWYLRAGGKNYVARLLAPKRALRELEPEVEGMVAGLAPGGAEAGRPDPRVFGRWEGPDGTPLLLDVGGDFSLGPMAGTFAASERHLTLRAAGRAPLELDYRLTDGGDALVVRGSGLGRDVTYRRAAERARSGPAGRWRARGSDLVLDLAAAGTFEFGPMRGSWSVDGGRLTLVGAKGEKISYRLELAGNGLTLSGGDLESPAVFDRAR